MWKHHTIADQPFPSHFRMINTPFYMRSHEIDIVICVCCGKDIDTWEAASKRLTNCIDSADYVVITPEKNLERFKAVTNPNIRVLSEESILPSSYMHYISKHLDQNSKQAGRASWLYQQFLKMEFALTCDKHRILIWDADTIPLKSIHFFDSNGSPRYFTGEEYHAPYFRLIRSVLGIGRKTRTSFIAQCLPFYRDTLQSMVQHIETSSGLDWKSGILTAIKPNYGPSPFSEYETIGTWMLSDLASSTSRPLPHESANQWERDGLQLIGSAKNLQLFTNHPALRDCYFVSFECSKQPFSHYIKLTGPIGRRTYLNSVLKGFSRLLRGDILGARCGYNNLKRLVRTTIERRQDVIIPTIDHFLPVFFEAAPNATVVRISATAKRNNDPIRQYLSRHKGQVIHIESSARQWQFDPWPELTSVYDIPAIDLLVLDEQAESWHWLCSLLSLTNLPRLIMYPDLESVSPDEAKALQENETLASLLTDHGYVFIIGSTNKIWGMHDVSPQC
jgi:hypothetical protein